MLKSSNILDKALRRLATSTTATTGSNARVRFAPSPTGHIHLGGLRTALYNYLFARQRNGQFILRIEDTDKKRIVPGSADEIENILEWAGIAPDESPRRGGPCGPYVQSERLDDYRRAASKLIEQGKAYRCFCSSARLELLRKYQTRNREKPHYDKKCRNLTPDEIKQKLEENDGTYVIRFALTDGETVFDDLVFGTNKTNLHNDSDPIILKSDGYPTYHLANIVDDKAMKITQVIRGSEWLTSTAKHIQIYEAFGWKPPQFLHFPLVNMSDGSKMSKRNNQTRVTEWIEAGHKPMALLNFLTNTGGGVPKDKQDSMQLWSLDEMIKGFDFNLITNHAATLDLSRLKVYNSKELKINWSKNPDAIVDELFDLLCKRNIQPDIDRNLAKVILSNFIDRISTLKDLLSSDYLFIWSYPQLSWPKQKYLDDDWNLKEILNSTIDTIELIGINDRQKFNTSLKKLASEHKVGFADYMIFLRKLLTNQDRGLPVFEIAECLGEERLISYLRKGLDYVTKED